MAIIPGKRNTVQKEVIERIVLQSCDHPSAEAIYERARLIVPTISLGTVYRVLKDLVKEGTVREIMVPSAPSRYDKTTRIHAHFICKLCGAVSDITVDEPRIMTEVISKNKNRIDEAEIIFRGTCPQCLKGEKV